MLPHQKNKIDISKLSEDEQRLFRLYGKLPSKKDMLSNKLKERKYFDSGDYALSKAGKASDVGVTQIGSKHPLPENIPHSHINTSGSTTSSSTASPAKESPLLHVLKNSLAQDSEGAAAEDSATPDSEGAQASPTNTSSVPARWQASSPDS